MAKTNMYEADPETLELVLENLGQKVLNYSEFLAQLDTPERKQIYRGVIAGLLHVMADYRAILDEIEVRNNKVNAETQEAVNDFLNDILIEMHMREKNEHRHDTES